MLDTIIAARLGRIPHLRSHDADEVGVLDEEGLEEWDHWNDCLGIRRGASASLCQATTLSTFNRLVQLVRILSDIICFDTAQNPNSEGNLQGRDNFNNVNNSAVVFYNGIVTRLDSWKALHGAIEENLVLPSRCNLYLTYLSIIMALNLRYPLGAPVIHLGQNTMQWLKLYADNFGLLVLPPILEYSLKLVGDCVTHSVDTGSTEHFSNASWIETWQQVSGALSEAWPVFQLSNSLPQSNSTTSIKPGILKRPSQQSGSTPNTASSLSQSTPDHWQVSQLATPRVFIETTPHSFHSPATMQQQQQPQPQFHSARMEPSLDQDSIFQEVYDMDANLWYVNMLLLGLFLYPKFSRYN